MSWKSRTARMAFVAMAALSFAGCGNRAPSEIKQGVRVVKSMLRPSNLSRSQFSVVYPDGKPSEFVSFMFSSMGVSEWPPYEGGPEDDPMMRDAMKTVGQPMIPSDVSLVARVPDPKRGKQVVVGYSDPERLVIVTGYLDPAAEPVLYEELQLPRVQMQHARREALEMMAKSNMDMGISPRSLDDDSGWDTAARRR